jgi:serine/threonine protein kinase
MHKLVSAVSHMHGISICHRDLKAENILFSSPSSVDDVKLIDFGLATDFT